MVWESPLEIAGLCGGEIRAEITTINSSCPGCTYNTAPAALPVNVDNNGITPSGQCQGICGDANQDGCVTIIDALQIAWESLGCPPGFPCPSAPATCLDADGSMSAVPDAGDVLYVAQFSVGLRCGLECP